MLVPRISFRYAFPINRTPHLVTFLDEMHYKSCDSAYMHVDYVKREKITWLHYNIQIVVRQCKSLFL